MADRLYAADLAYSTLDGGINDSVTTLTVASAAGFPSSIEVPFLIGIGTEVIKVGAVNTGTGVMSTLTRGYGGSAAAAHLDGATVACKVFAEYVNNVYEFVDGKAATIHNLVDTTNHPVTGLTTGHFLKATGAATYGFTSLNSVAINMGDTLLTRPVLKDYGETAVVATGVTGATTINLENGNVIQHTLSDATTYTFSNPPASGTAGGFTLIIIQPAAFKVVTWPASVKWTDGFAPEIGVNSGIFILTFMTLDAGTVWYGSLFGSDMKVVS